MTVEEVQADLLEYSKSNKMLSYGYDKVTIKVKYESGHLEVPLRYDWLARMVEFYGMTQAVSYAIMIVRKWFSR